VNADEEHPVGRRPAVVAIGGGHGAAATLRATRDHARCITAVVSAADDGGSSGRLRDALAMPAPGDLRRCLVALSPPSALADAFEHRFASGELEGHPLGNLLIAGLHEATGDFVAALEEVNHLLGAVGGVYPASAEPVTLKAEVAGDGAEVEGQVAVMHAEGVRQVTLVPPDPPAPRQALAAIAEADQIVIGPGSLYTSVLAALAVPEVAAAVSASSARTVYVANLAASEAETQGYDLADHVAALERHGVRPDVVVAHPGAMPIGDLRVQLVEAPVARANGLAHDPELLAAVLRHLW
jgi:uncharacterized cofD-like protein